MNRRPNKLMILLLAAAGSAGALLSQGDPAGAAFPGANGKIAFVGTDADGDGEIFVVNPDGSGLTQLTANNLVQDVRPAWSADGTKIAFARSDLVSGNAGIVVMNADGSGQTQLSTRFSDFPTWSPDGTKIAFESFQGGRQEIFVMNADGSGETQLTTAGASRPEWSPDGTKIAFQSLVTASTCCDISVMNADGSGLTVLAGGAGGRHPSWSPDGTKIAFERNGGIFTMNADGSGQTQLTFPSGSFSDSQPAWSPDGTKIAFQRLEGLGTSLFVMSADGSGQTLVTTTLDTRFDPPRPAAGNPDWQPLFTQTVFADLALTLAGSANSANTKKAFTYTISVENRGPGPAAGVVVADVLDPNERFSSVTTSRGSCTSPAVGSSGTVRCDLGQLPVSESAEIVVVIELPSKKEFGSAKPQITNTASVGGSTADAVVGNNAATLVTKVVGP